MSEPVLNERQQQRADWRMRSFEWLLARVGSNEEDKEQFLAMWNAAIEEAFNEGTDEAADLLAGIRAKHPTRELEVAERSIRELARRNRIPLSAGG